MLHDLPDIAIALILLGAFVLAWRTDGDDPEWEAHWSALSPADRGRIAAARSGSLLSSEEEIELAAGYARRDRRRRSPYTLVNAIRLLLGVVLLIFGLVADSILFFVFGILFTVGGVWSINTNRRVTRAEREAISRARHY